MHDQKWTLSYSWKVLFNGIEIILLRCLRSLNYRPFLHFYFSPLLLRIQWQMPRHRIKTYMCARHFDNLNVCKWQAHFEHTMEIVLVFGFGAMSVLKNFIHRREKRNIGKLFHLYSTNKMHIVVTVSTQREKKKPTSFFQSCCFHFFIQSFMLCRVDIMSIQMTRTLNESVFAL